MEKTDRVAASSDTGHEIIRQPFFRGKNLLPSFPPDDRLKITDHHGIRMCPQDRSQNIMCGPHIGRPIPHGLADGILERAAAGIDARHRRAQQTHAKDVQRLPLHVFRRPYRFRIASPNMAAAVAVATPC